MRLIDTDELKEWVEYWFTKNKYYHPYSKSNDIPINELYDILEQMPTIEAEPVRRGKWIEDDIDKWRCSVCQKGDVYAFSWSISEGYELQDNYCPHCGAKMDVNEVEK